MVLDANSERTGAVSAVPALVDEYLDLKEKLEPLEKRLQQVKNLLKDLVTEESLFVDELRGVTVYLQPRQQAVGGGDDGVRLLWLTKRHHGSAESNAGSQGAAETSTDSRLGMEPRISVYSRAVKWKLHATR